MAAPAPLARVIEDCSAEAGARTAEVAVAAADCVRVQTQPADRAMGATAGIRHVDRRDQPRTHRCAPRSRRCYAHWLQPASTTRAGGHSHLAPADEAKMVARG